MDAFFTLVSARAPWVPYYALLLAALAWQYKGRWHGYALLLLALGLVVLSTDQLATFVKESTARHRPCHSPWLVSSLHIIPGACGGEFGFFSAHAANSAGVVALLTKGPRRMVNSSLIRPIGEPWSSVLAGSSVVWALLLGYSRVYLGLHFPSDVLAGWVAGSTVGSLIAALYITMIMKTL